MTFQPILERELRVASRRGATYWTRCQVVATALVPLAFLLSGLIPFGSQARMGQQTFQVLIMLAFVSAMLAVVRLTADCLSSEKRDGTLGFLFLTDLKASDVVVGKLAATSMSAVYGLLALVPVMTIPVLCGGVTLGDVARLILVLGNALFFALSLAMLVSALNWQEKKAMGLTVILLIAIGAGLPLAGEIATIAGGSRGFASVLSMASPGYACQAVMSASYGANSSAFWISVAVTHGLGWIFLWLTCRVLPRVWQDRPSGGWLLRWREWCRSMQLGKPALRVEFRRRLLGVNPVFWLASREQRMWWYPWILLGSLAIIGGVTCGMLKVQDVEFGPVILSFFSLHAIFKHWIANEACYAFSSDRDKGALELLLSTPLGMKDMIHGHWLGLRRRFLAPLSLLIVVELVLLAMAGLGDSHGRSNPLFWLSLGIFAVVVFVADSFALTWTGWWSGVVSRNASSALSATYLRLMIIPWTLGLAAFLLFMFAFDPSDEVGQLAALFLWVATSLGADLYFGLRARHKLLTELRAAAVERYSGGDPAMRWWRRLGRSWGLRMARSRPTGSDRIQATQ